MAACFAAFFSALLAARFSPTSERAEATAFVTIARPPRHPKKIATATIAIVMLHAVMTNCWVSE